MSLKDYAVMPYSDYEGACDAIREKDGSSAPIKSGELRAKILGIETGADVSGVTAIAEDVLAGKIIVDADGNPVEGTMTNRGKYTSTITSKTQSKTIQKGFHDGTGKISISTTEQNKIIPSNIKKGVTILGVAGSLEEGAAPAGYYYVIDGKAYGNNTKTFTITDSNIIESAGFSIILYYSESFNMCMTKAVVGDMLTASDASQFVLSVQAGQIGFVSDTYTFSSSKRYYYTIVQIPR